MFGNGSRGGTWGRFVSRRKEIQSAHRGEQILLGFGGTMLPYAIQLLVLAQMCCHILPPCQTVPCVLARNTSQINFK